MSDSTRQVRIPSVEFGRSGSIYAVSGCWFRHARQQGWAIEEIEAVTDRVFASKSYGQALGILRKHTDFIRE